jgi:hypothetical protein
MSPNDFVKIKPTERGWEMIIKYVDEFNDHIKANHPKAQFRLSVPKADQDGYIREQFWSLMGYFNWNKGIGQDLPFSDLKLSN